jgi:adenylosuccinate lyase
MIDRYSRKKMKELFDARHKLDVWLEVERAATRVLSKRGIVDPDAARMLLEAKIRPDIERMEAIEEETRHDVIAFLTMVSEQLPQEARAILHFGMTSQDLVDTAQSLILLDAVDVIVKDMERFMEILKAKALEHRKTLMVGRSHGVHGEPIVFGVKFLAWHAEFQRHTGRLRQARENMRVGKMSGAMGTAVHISPDIESDILESLSLKPEDMATQVVSRDRHAELVCAIALIGTTLEKIAVEIRHLQRTEVHEVEEPFRKGQKGSSAMPHKRNPIGTENISGLSRLLRSFAQAAFENVALWHERDISHSSVERVILPDAFQLLDYMMDRLGGILDNLVVYPERMKANLDLTGGLVYSQSVLLALVKTGLTREKAYKIVQDAAMQTWSGEGNFRETLARHPDFPDTLLPSVLEKAFDPEQYMHNIDALYKRVLGDDGRG